MGSWLTEQDLRHEYFAKHDFHPGLLEGSAAPSVTEAEQFTDESHSLTLNAAFLTDIKHDTVKPEEVIREFQDLLSKRSLPDPGLVVETLARLRDELQTCFALEEFYGYFDSAKISNSHVNVRATCLRSQHEEIFLDVRELVELAEGMLYQELSVEESMPAIVAGFQSLVQNFHCHEMEEHDLIMRLCNDDIGGSD